MDLKKEVQEKVLSSELPDKLTEPDIYEYVHYIYASDTSKT